MKIFTSRQIKEWDRYTIEHEPVKSIDLMALLSLGFRNIRLGPTLPAFVSPGVARTLLERFGLCGIGGVDGDIKSIMG